MLDCCENWRHDVRLVSLIFLPKQLDTLYARNLPGCTIDAMGQRHCRNASFEQKFNRIDGSRTTIYPDLWCSKTQNGHVQPRFPPLPSIHSLESQIPSSSLTVIYIYFELSYVPQRPSMVQMPPLDHCTSMASCETRPWLPSPIYAAIASSCDLLRCPCFTHAVPEVTVSKRLATFHTLELLVQLPERLASFPFLDLPRFCT